MTKFWMIFAMLLTVAAPVHAGILIHGKVLDFAGVPVPEARVMLMRVLDPVAAAKAELQGNQDPDVSANIEKDGS